MWTEFELLVSTPGPISSRGLTANQRSWPKIKLLELHSPAPRGMLADRTLVDGDSIWLSERAESEASLVRCWYACCCCYEVACRWPLGLHWNPAQPARESGIDTQWDTTRSLIGSLAALLNVTLFALCPWWETNLLKVVCYYRGAKANNSRYCLATGVACVWLVCHSLCQLSFNLIALSTLYVHS